jgi:hypothetical protein
MNASFGKSGTKLEVLPVWRAPVSMPTGCGREECRSCGSISGGIHTVHNMR